MIIIRFFFIFGLVTSALLATLIIEGKYSVFNALIYNSNFKMYFSMKILFKSRLKQCFLSVKRILGEHVAAPCRKDSLCKTD